MTTPRRPKRNQENKLNSDRQTAGLGGPGTGTAQPGVTATGIHNLDPEEGELFTCDPADISPNPMNRRLTMRRMDEMISSVQRQGIHTPGAAISMRLFIKQYPEWADQIENPKATYILGPGHRRRLAAVKAGKPMLVILRNQWAKDRTVEENLISENSDRDDLSPIEEALQLDLLRQRGMTGDQIAERSGYKHRGTVSRLLNLLTLPEAIQDAVHVGPGAAVDQDEDEPAVFGISPRAGYALSTIKDAEGNNDSEAAHALQLRAFEWMRDAGLSAEAAKNRLQSEAARGSAPEVFPAGNTAAAPAASAAPAEAGSADTDHVSRGKQGGAADAADDGKAGPDGADVSRGKHDGAAEGEPSIPHQADGSADAHGTDEQDYQDQDEKPAPGPAAEAAETRDLACRLLLDEERYAGAGEVTGHLVNAVLNPSEWKAAATLAHAWLRELGKGPDEKRPVPYIAAVAASGDANLMRRVAFAVSLAADELRAAQPGRDWDQRDRAHVAFLIASKAAYQPTAWEQDRLAPVTTA